MTENKTDNGLNRQAASQAVVELPARYRKHLPHKEFMYAEDFAFFEGLLRKYGLNGGNGIAGTEKKRFGRGEYFAAGAELKDYLLGLHQRFNPAGLYTRLAASTVPMTNDVFKEYKAMAEDDPVKKRSLNLVKLFQMHPTVKQQYRKVHMKKMESAFPPFVTYLKGEDTRKHRGLAYFAHAAKGMRQTMMDATYDFTVEEVDTAGFLEGFDENGYLPAASSRRAIFAGRGVGTSMEALYKIVNSAIDYDQDQEQVVRREYLETDGIASMLMGTSRADFVNHGKQIILADTSLAAKRREIQIANFSKGACPAMGNSSEPLLDGQKERQIAYAYAHIIISYMPPSYTI